MDHLKCPQNTSHTVFNLLLSMFCPRVDDSIDFYIKYQ